MTRSSTGATAASSSSKKKANNGNGNGEPAEPNNPQSILSKEEIESRGSGTEDDVDTYDSQQFVRSEKRVFFTAVIFLTRLPCPLWTEADHHPAFLMRSMMHFPFLGFIIGLWVVLWLEAAHVLWSPWVAVAISTLAGVWLTGAFHEDGLADSLDALGGGWGRTQILRIMQDTRVGTYALVGTILILGMKLASLAQLLAVGAPSLAASTEVPFLPIPLTTASVALLVAHTVSRWTSLPLIYLCHYIQDEESSKRHLYNWFANSQRLLTLPRLFLGTLFSVAIPWWFLPLHQALLVYLVTVLVTILAGYYFTLILGGVVGDLLGATIQVCELAVYLMLTADLDKLQTAWQPLALLGGVAVLPILLSRPIIDFSSRAPLC